MGGNRRTSHLGTAAQNTGGGSILGQEECSVEHVRWMAPRPGLIRGWWPGRSPLMVNEGGGQDRIIRSGSAARDRGQRHDGEVSASARCPGNIT